MATCSKQRDPAVDLLSAEQRFEFEDHLGNCQRCAENHRANQTFDAQFKNAFSQERTPSVSDTQLRRLLWGLGNAKAPLRYARLLMATSLVLVCMVGGFLLWFDLGTSSASTPSQQVVQRNSHLTEAGDHTAVTLLSTYGGTVTPLSKGQGAVLKVQNGGRMVARAGGARIGLASQSQVTFISAGPGESRFILNRGGCVFDVNPRKNTSPFIVEAGGVQIRVVGTLFEVSLSSSNAVRLSLVEGSISIHSPQGGTSALSAAHAVEITPDGQIIPQAYGEENQSRVAEALSLKPASQTPEGRDPSQAEAASSPKTDLASLLKTQETSADAETVAMASIRRLIVAGSLDQAESSLDAYLREHPSSFKAWQLKGDCLRKQKKWDDSVKAYKAAIHRASPREANRTRLSAAIVCQDWLSNPQQAIPFLEAYLKQPAAFTPMQAEVMYRLGKAHATLGHTSEATYWLKTVSREHSGSIAATAARKLLTSLQTP